MYSFVSTHHFKVSVDIFTLRQCRGHPVLAAQCLVPDAASLRETPWLSLMIQLRHK